MKSNSIRDLSELSEIEFAGKHFANYAPFLIFGALSFWVYIERSGLNI